MSLRKILTGFCLVAFGLTILSLSAPRTIAYGLVFPHKQNLTSPSVSAADLSNALGAYRDAFSWHGHQDFLIAQSQLLAKSSMGKAPEGSQSFYNDRILLIEAALQQGGYSPYQLFVLANLRYLDGWELQTVIQTLKLSIATGPYVGALYVPRFKSIALLWDKLTSEQQREFLPAVKKAYERHPDEIIALSKTNKSSFSMVSAVLRDDPSELIKFARQVLKK